jgi:hypothetical protein
LEATLEIAVVFSDENSRKLQKSILSKTGAKTSLEEWNKTYFESK